MDVTKVQSIGKSDPTKVPSTRALADDAKIDHSVTTSFIRTLLPLGAEASTSLTTSILEVKTDATCRTRSGSPSGVPRSVDFSDDSNNTSNWSALRRRKIGLPSSWCFVLLFFLFFLLEVDFSKKSLSEESESSEADASKDASRTANKASLLALRTRRRKIAPNSTHVDKEDVFFL